MLPPSDRSDRLAEAKGLLFLAGLLVALPIILMTADHQLRQKPGSRQQQAVFRAIGLSAPCFFPAGHPARTRRENPGTIDWRIAPSLPRPAPGPVDLVRPRPASGKGFAHDR